MAATGTRWGEDAGGRQGEEDREEAPAAAEMSPQPQQQPPPQPQQQQQRGLTWRHTLCSFDEDLDAFCEALWCPCTVQGKSVSAMMGQGGDKVHTPTCVVIGGLCAANVVLPGLGTAFIIAHAGLHRNQIAQKIGIEEPLLTSYAHSLLLPCALVQEYREMRERNMLCGAAPPPQEMVEGNGDGRMHRSAGTASTHGGYAPVPEPSSPPDELLQQQQQQQQQQQHEPGWTRTAPTSPPVWLLGSNPGMSAPPGGQTQPPSAPYAPGGHTS